MLVCIGCSLVDRCRRRLPLLPLLPPLPLLLLLLLQ
jgi:hypothetical protein